MLVTEGCVIGIMSMSQNTRQPCCDTATRGGSLWVPVMLYDHKLDQANIAGTADARGHTFGSCRICFRLCLLLVHSTKQHLARHLELRQQLLEARAGNKVIEHQAMAALPPVVKKNSQHLVHHTL